jgi:hypothetical protein
MAIPEKNTVFPPYAEVWFGYKSDTILKLPSFLFLRLLLASRPQANNDQEFQRLSSWADDLSQDQGDEEVFVMP